MEQIDYPYLEVMLVFGEDVLSLPPISPDVGSIKFVSGFLCSSLRLTSKDISMTPFVQNEQIGER